MTLPGVFGDPEPTTTTPMHKAWAHALIEKLVPTLQDRLAVLATDGAGWTKYVEIARETEATIAQEQASKTESEDPMAGFRPPSAGAQPVFLDLFLTTVFMRGRSVYRRIIERLVTAQEDGVDSYMARALLGSIGDTTNTPVRAMWGCEAAPVVVSRPGEPILTRLRFPRKLRRGEKHYFCSEATDENVTTGRLWINIEVDHYGIAPGRRMHGYVPISGLTIRVLFDHDDLPEACWWYAEQTERERSQRPPDGDPHLLTIVSNTVEHTFAQKCHPRENYGIYFLWPES